MIGNSAACSPGSAERVMTMTATIAPRPARLAPLAILFLVHRPMGAVKEMGSRREARGEGVEVRKGRLRLNFRFC